MIVSMTLSAVLVLSSLAWPVDLDKALETAKAKKRPDLCHQYGQLEKITELLDRRVFYLIPTINPDGRDSWLHDSHTASSSRTGQDPYDNDRDGLIDEDGPNDLDGDGSITRMRVRDPMGRCEC